MKKVRRLKKKTKKPHNFGLVRKSTSLSGVLFDNDSKCTTCIPMHPVITIMLMVAFFFWKLEKQLMKRGLVKKITVSKTMEYKFYYINIILLQPKKSEGAQIKAGQEAPRKTVIKYLTDKLSTMFEYIEKRLHNWTRVWE